MRSSPRLVQRGVSWFASPGGAVVCLVAALTILSVQRVPIVSGDTSALANSASSLVECLRNHQWVGCPGATQFGITQYLPAMILSWRGMGPDGIVVVLSLINCLCFVLFGWLVWKFPLTHQNSRSLLVLCAVCSPMISYASFSFGEGLVGFLVLASLYALCSRHHLLFLVSVIGAIASKETAVVTLTPIVLATYMVIPKDRRIRASIVVFGCAAGVALLVCFNYFKFGTWQNVIHSDPVLRATGVGRRSEIFLGLIFSPNGGLFWYWPVSVLLVAVLMFLAISAASRIGLSAAAPSVLVLVSFLAQLLGLSNWYAPFGWVAWGPRLMVPTVVGLVVVSVLVIDSLPEQSVKVVKMAALPLKRTFHTAIAVCAIGSVVTAVGFLRDPSSSLAWFGRISPTCPTPAIIQQDPNYYFKCLSYGMWSTDRSIIELSLRSFSGRWASVALAAVFLIVRQLICVGSPSSRIGDVQRDKDQTEDHYAERY